MNTVRTIRRNRGLTMTALAIKAEIPIATLSRIEAGARCSQLTATKLAEALEAKAQELFPEFASMRPF